jgi:MFS family permease
MWLVQGQFRVSKTTDPENTMSGMSLAMEMITDGIKYIRSSFFGPLVLLDASAALLAGATDVLNVSFSERGSIEGRSTRLGVLFACVGIGCVLGPLICDSLVSISNPRTSQRLCLWGFGAIALGYFVMGSLSDSFALVCVTSAFRSVGASLISVNAALLLQKFSAPEMLGRVRSIDYSLSLLTEALSAIVAGILQDSGGLSPEQVSLVFGVVGIGVLGGWIIYHRRGLGAASYEKPLLGKETAELLAWSQ